MYIPALVPTHNRLRSPEKLKFISEDYDKTICLSRVEGTLYVHDGHHRLVYEYLRGKYTLPDEFFKITDYTIEDYNSVNFEKMYVTPFNIISECRTPDFFTFKEVIKTQIHSMHFDEATKINMTSAIRGCKKFYVEPRVVFTIKDMATNLLEKA